ncbi:MAG TPA: flagellar hook-length control protein FliK [Stellaceae bacterium]|jgi:hypothetical protein|nr:flagellar hook-length control protein FliK [Stellaceae bacterium]
MSSLRISQHRAAIGAAVGTSGNAPADAAADGASFAGALDAAGAGARGPSSPGETAGDASGDPPPSRKRGEPAGNAGAATLADIAGAALAALPSAAANAASGGFGALSPAPIATAPAASTGGNRSVLTGKAPSVGSANGDNPAPGAPAGPLAAALASAASTGSEAAGNPTAGSDGLGAPGAMQPSIGPAAVSLPDRAVTSEANAASVNSALVGFPTAIGGSTAADAPSRRAADAGREEVAPGIAGIRATTLVAASPAMTGTAGASPGTPPSDSGGASALAIDPATGVSVGLVSNTSTGASAATTGDPLPPLGSVPASSGLVGEVRLPVALASTGDATRDDRGRSPFGSALDAGITSTAAAGAPATGTDASPVAVTTSAAPAPDPSSPGGVSDQVAAHLVRMVSSGSRDMVVRLRPPELGDVTVRIAVTGRDVAAWFASPEPQVQNAISAAIGQLQTSLGDAGYNLSGAWVGGGAANAQQEQSNSPPPAASRVLSVAVALSSRAAAQLPAASGLNIYV